MGNPLLLSFSLCFLVLFNVCLATDQNIQGYRSRRYGESQRYGEGQRRYRECRLDRLDALEPSNRIEAEGGVIEMWDPNHEEFQCAGVAFQRYLIDPKGLLLPQYTNAPRLMYVERGRGFKGVVLSGCPETYQESQQSAGEFRDRHQKIRRVRTGDLFAVPAGSAHWTYNDGNEKLIIVVLLDVSNHANQLDFHPRVCQFEFMGRNKFTRFAKFKKFLVMGRNKFTNFTKLKKFLVTGPLVITALCNGIILFTLNISLPMITP